MGNCVNFVVAKKEIVGFDEDGNEDSWNDAVVDVVVVVAAGPVIVDVLAWQPQHHKMVEVRDAEWEQW